MFLHNYSFILDVLLGRIPKDCSTIIQIKFPYFEWIVYLKQQRILIPRNSSH